MQEKCKKNARKIQNASPTRENVSILYYVLGKNVSCVLLAFSLHFAHKLYQLAELLTTHIQSIITSRKT